VNRSAVFVDTHAVVAGLLTGNEASPVAKVLNGVLAAAFPFVLSRALLADTAQSVIVQAPGAGPAAAPDAGDQLLWDLLAARADLRLVTGDKALLRELGMPARVTRAREFVEAPRGRQPPGARRPTGAQGIGSTAPKPAFRPPRNERTQRTNCSTYPPPRPHAA
jgi:hypothetical protein